MPYRTAADMALRVSTGGLVQMAGVAGLVGGGAIQVAASTAIPVVPITPSVGTIGGSVSIVCGMLAIVVPAILKYFEGKRVAELADAKDAREAKLKEIAIHENARIRSLEAEIALLRRQTAANTVQANANTARTAALSGAVDGMVQRQQDSGSMPVPGSSDAIPSDQWPRLLLVEDSPDDARATTRILAKSCFNVTPAANVLEALSLLKERFALALIDLHLPDGDGLAVLSAIRDARLDTRVVVATADDSPETLARIASLRPDATLVKPYDPDDLIAALKG